MHRIMTIGVHGFIRSTFLEHLRPWMPANCSTCVSAEDRHHQAVGKRTRRVLAVDYSLLQFGITVEHLRPR